MSVGSTMLRQGWDVLLAHHGTPIEYHATCGDGYPYLSTALVSKPADPAQFTRRNMGVSYVLFVDQSAAPWAVDACVIMEGVTYRVLQVERQPAAISVRLLVGVSPVAGRRT